VEEEEVKVEEEEDERVRMSDADKIAACQVASSLAQLADDVAACDLLCGNSSLVAAWGAACYSNRTFRERHPYIQVCAADLDGNQEDEEEQCVECAPLRSVGAVGDVASEAAGVVARSSLRVAMRRCGVETPSPSHPLVQPPLRGSEMALRGSEQRQRIGSILREVSAEKNKMLYLDVRGGIGGLDRVMFLSKMYTMQEEQIRHVEAQDQFNATGRRQRRGTGRQHHRHLQLTTLGVEEDLRNVGTTRATSAL
jgi:hypothetical protein